MEAATTTATTVTVEIPLTGGYKTIVDAVDIALVNSVPSWNYVNKDGLIYAIRGHFPSRGQSTSLHRLIMGAAPRQIVDHVNGDTLDNRRCNLRFASLAENNRNGSIRKANRSGFKGVDWHLKGQAWRAQITHNHKKYHLGYHPTAEEAACVYDKAALEFHGEFARLNFPQ